MKKLAVFILKSGLKQFNQFKEEYDHAYLDSGQLFPGNLQKDYDEVVLVDSTAASGITLLKAKSTLESMGFRNIKLAAYPITKYAETILDIKLPKQDPIGNTIFISGLPGQGKSAFAYGLSKALDALYVKWGKEISKRFNIGKYGEELAKLEEDNPFLVSERLITDGVFNTEKEFIVVDGIKSIWQAIHVSYATLRPAISFFLEVPQEVRELIINTRQMVDDPYDEERKALFLEKWKEVRDSSIIIRLDEKFMDNVAKRVFQSLGIDPTIKGYFNPFITKENILTVWFLSWKKINNTDTPLIDKWIESQSIKMHKGYIERLRKNGITTSQEVSELIVLSATSSRIIDDVLDEHTKRFYSEEGVTEEAWWVKRGIYLALIDSVILMAKAKRIAKRLGVESELINTFDKMVKAVMVELELERTRRKPTLEDWLKAVERETAFREFIYSLVGLDPEKGYVDGVIAQAKDDLYGVTKGGREDMDTTLNRPLLQRVYPNAEEVLDDLKKAKSKEDVLSIFPR